MIMKVGAQSEGVVDANQVPMATRNIESPLKISFKGLLSFQSLWMIKEEGGGVFKAQEDERCRCLTTAPLL